MHVKTNTLIALIAVLTCGFARGQTVWSANPPGSPGPTLQQLANGAADGDVIALAPGTDPTHLVVNGKGLVLLGDENQFSSIGSIRFAGLPATSSVALHSVGCFGLELVDMDGPVLLDSCFVLAWTDSLLARNCAMVELVESVVSSSSGDGGVGARLSNTHLVAAESQFHAEDGLPGLNLAFCTSGVDGGAGGTGLVVQQGSTAWLSSCTLRGGCGGPGGFSPTCSGSPGSNAPGLFVSSDSLAFLRSSLEMGCIPSQGPITRSSEPPRALDVPAVVDSRADIPVSLEGALGDTVFLLVSRGSRPFFAGAEEGWYQSDLSPGAARRRLGGISGQAPLTRNLLAPHVPPGEVSIWYLQAVFIDALGRVRFAPVRMLLVAGDGALP